MPDSVLSRLHALPTPVQWGLERVERLLASVDDPHERYAVVHVAGTNGKGSVAAMTASVLQAAGHRTGLYTSPHLCHFRERVRVNGEPLPDDRLRESAERVWPAVERERPSFFEATTALAFDAFAGAEIDVAVVETGLGGRLDATNVVRPVATAVTNVSLEHAGMLGSTVAEIAREKAGIIKAGVPVVTAADHPDALAVLREVAQQRSAPLHMVEPPDPAVVSTGLDGTAVRIASDLWGTLNLHTRLIGLHQATNTALAVRLLESLPESLVPSAQAVADGVARAAWPGRLQVERRDGRVYVFDVAHNPAAADALVESLERLPLPRPLIFLVGILADKDRRGMLARLERIADRLVLTVPPGAPEDRRWDPSTDGVSLPAGAQTVGDFGRALGRSGELAGQGTVVVTGSFHTVGDALTALGMRPCADSPLPLPADTV